MCTGFISYFMILHQLQHCRLWYNRNNKETFLHSYKTFSMALQSLLGIIYMYTDHTVLIAQEDFIKFTRRESTKTYNCEIVWYLVHVHSSLIQCSLESTFQIKCFAVRRSSLWECYTYILSLLHMCTHWNFCNWTIICWKTDKFNQQRHTSKML
jgi:hypothetical protein